MGLPGPGTLREALNSDDARFGGHDVHNMAPAEAYPEPFCGQPWSARVTLPPMSCVYYYYDTKEGSET